MKVKGENKLVKGGVLFVLAGTLAAHSLGGFKVGVGFRFESAECVWLPKSNCQLRYCNKQDIYVMQLHIW